jgi:methionyl-tRNA synthetase
MSEANELKKGSVLEPSVFVPFKEFQKLDMRVGKVLSAERVPDTRNLLKLQVDFGDEQLQAVSGLAQQFEPGQLVGNKYMFIVNLERKKFKGIESQCMIFAAEDMKGKLALMAPGWDIDAGSKVY